LESEEESEGDFLLDHHSE